MSCLRTIVFLALLCAVVKAVEHNDKPPPQDGNHDHHESHPVPFEATKTNEIPRESFLSSHIIAKIGERKIFRPPLFRPYYYPLLHQPHSSTEAETEETESQDNKTKPKVQPYDQADSTNDVNPIAQTEEQGDETAEELLNVVRMANSENEVPCDFLTVPRYSCYTCYTYLVCKPKGGKVKSCAEPGAPYCNDGVCSATPSAECSKNSTTLL